MLSADQSLVEQLQSVNSHRDRQREPCALAPFCAGALYCGAGEQAADGCEPRQRHEEDDTAHDRSTQKGSEVGFGKVEADEKRNRQGIG